MSAAIGGRSESIGAAPDRSASQVTSDNKAKNALNAEEVQNFENLSEEELAILTGDDAESKIIPFGARLGNLFARSEFLRGLSNKFIGAPSGANVDRKVADSRVTTLDETIAQAQEAQKKNSADRSALEKSGIRIFSGSPLDFAFSNKARSINNIISQAKAEKQGILLQTSTDERKKQFENFRVTTDKRNGKGRNRGLFDVSGRGGLSKAQAEQIQKQELTVADLETAKANVEEIDAFGKKRTIFNKRTANMDNRSGARAARSRRSQSQFGNVGKTQRIDDRPDKEFFTDQLLSNDTTKVTRINSPEFAASNAAKLETLNAQIAAKEAFLSPANVNKLLGAPVPFSRRFSSNMKSGTNSKGTSDKEREQFFRTHSGELRGLKDQRRDLTNLSENPITTVANNNSIGKRRQASLFEALGTLNRVLGLPQFNGTRGSATQLKANVGALNKVQNQRISEQKKEKGRLQTKLDFDKELADINASGELNQKQKKNAIFKAAKKRDENLKGKIATNTQFEQSRAGFAASRTNIVSGHTVRSVQDFIDLGRKKRRINL